MVCERVMILTRCIDKNLRLEQQRSDDVVLGRCCWTLVHWEQKKRRLLSGC